MISQELFDKMELLNKSDIKHICDEYSINTKIFTSQDNNDLIKTKNTCSKYDMIKLVKMFLSGNNNPTIVYHDFNNLKNNEKNNINMFISFKNVKQIRPFVRKTYKEMFDIPFDYDKISYIILNSYWTKGDPITVKKFCSLHYEHFKDARSTITNKKSNVNVNYDKMFKDIKNVISEYVVIKYEINNK